MKKGLMGGAAAIALLVCVDGAGPADAAQPVDWSGWYAGFHAGYGDANFDGVHDNTDTGIFLDNLDLDGFAGGFHAGFNHQMPAVAEGIDAYLVGMEADVTVTDWKDSVANADPITVTADVDLLASVRGRLGAVIDNALLFVTGGVAFKDADVTVVGTDGTVGKVDLDDVGGVVGLGIEFAPFDTSRALVRVEGLYYIFDDEESTAAFSDGDPGDAAEFDDAFVVRAGVTIPFNGPLNSAE